MNKKRKSPSLSGVWDYDLSALDLSNPQSARWYLERKIDYCDWSGIDYDLLKQYLPVLSVDPAKKKVLAYFIDWHEYTYPSAKTAS